MALKGKHLLTTRTWTDEELNQVIELALEMKQNPLHKKWSALLKGKSILLLFHNQSLRTHLSFEKAVLELGGHSHYRTPAMGWIKTENKNQSGESVKDAARVISRYVEGIGIRLTLDAVSRYGEGHKILSGYAKWATVPVINMADDRYHPCQGLADLMGWAEWQSTNQPDKPVLNNLKGKKLLLTWGKSGLARPWSSVQSHLLLASRFGMHVTLAHPSGYELDPEICEEINRNCINNKTTFEIINDPDSGYQNADVVYVRNWITKDAYQSGRLNYTDEVSRSLSFTDWMVTTNRMQKTNNAIFANPMPLDRGNEVEEAVADSDRSIIYEVAENRLHIQKAIMALTMGDIE